MGKADGDRPKTGQWCVYLLEKDLETNVARGGQGCRNTYVGMTNNFEKRFGEHNAGKARATQGYAWKALAKINVEKRQEAAAVEAWLKCGDSRKKRADFAALCPFGIEPEAENAQEFLRRAMLWHAQRSLRTGLFKKVA